MISVIVPVYKAEKYLHRCVDSILAQSYTDFELLLINDGSPDNCGAICDEYAIKDSRVRVFHKENGGASTARNLGLDEARGEWITFVDSDDWIESNMYEEMICAAQQYSVDAVYCDMVLEGSTSSNTLQYNSLYCDHQLMYDCLAPVNVVYFSVCNKLISRKVFDKYNLRAALGANMWEDVELAVKIRYYVPSSHVINKGFYHYDGSNIASTTHKALTSRIEGQVERVKQMERFFKETGEWKRYKHFVSLLKFQAKSELWGTDKLKWTTIFREARKSLYRFTHVYSKLEILQYLLISYFGRILIPIYRFLRR